MSRVVKQRLTFAESGRLRDEIVARGWARDLIGVKAWGQDIIKGRPPKGYRVVLAWADGRFRRITSSAEAEKFLPHAATPDRTSQETRQQEFTARSGFRQEVNRAAPVEALP